MSLPGLSTVMPLSLMSWLSSLAMPTFVMPFCLSPPCHRLVPLFCQPVYDHRYRVDFQCWICGMGAATFDDRDEVQEEILIDLINDRGDSGAFDEDDDKCSQLQWEIVLGHVFSLAAQG